MNGMQQQLLGAAANSSSITRLRQHISRAKFITVVADKFTARTASAVLSIKAIEPYFTSQQRRAECHFHC